MLDAILGALGWDWQAMAAIMATALAAIGWAFFKGRGTAKDERDADDNARANAIENAADRARRADDAGADPLDRLRDAGRIRD